MRNHFHVTLKTPEANLVRGMHWLESTFANRFNRLRGEHGHLFQGRYTALVIGDEETLGQVSDYIHLNPAAAGITDVPNLPSYRYSSYWYWFHPAARQPFMELCARMGASGPASDDAAGREAYAAHLANELIEGRRDPRRYVRLTRGWAIGSDAFKARLIEQHRLSMDVARAWTVEGTKFMRAASWQRELHRLLVALGRTAAEARDQQCSEPWKLAVATWLRERHGAKSKWLSEQLHLGTPSVASRNLARFRQSTFRDDPTWQAIRSSFAA